MPVAVAGRSRHSQSRPARSKVTTLQSKGSSMAWRWSLEDGCGGKMYSWFMNIYKYIYTCIYIYTPMYMSMYMSMYTYIYIYIYISRDPHTPPPRQMVPPPVAGEGGFSQQPSRLLLVSIHRNHGVCSLYSAYSAYVSIIRMDILYVI